MREFKHIFGPVPSRRFGRSLGVDLTSYKTCDQDCVFCQLGRTTNMTVAREEYVPLGEVIAELEEWLKIDGKADYITLSGSGEPTLHSRFGEVLRFVRENSSIKAVLLTNGSLFHLPQVRSAARHAHLVKVSLSAWDQASYGWVNRPHPDLGFKQLIEGQSAFRAEFPGELWMEVFMVAGVNSASSDVGRIAALSENLRPDRIHLNTAIRPPAEDFVSALSREHLNSLRHLFRPAAEVIGDFQAQNCNKTEANRKEIVSMIKRRPCTAEEIAEAFGMHLNEVFKYLGELAQQKGIRVERADTRLYYSASGENAEDFLSGSANSSDQREWA